MDELRLGQKVKIHLTIPPSHSAEFSCDIKWIEPDRIGLTFPQGERNLIKYLQEETEVGVLVYTEKGIRVFDSIIIDDPISEENFVIEFPEELTKIQRRDYVRVPITLEVILTREDRRIRTQTVNISGSGIRFKINHELAVGELWDFILYLPNLEEPIRGSGEIIYTVNQNYNMFSVIKFTEINEVYRNKIIKLCFEEEAIRFKRM